MNRWDVCFLTFIWRLNWFILRFRSFLFSVTFGSTLLSVAITSCGDTLFACYLYLLFLLPKPKNHTSDSSCKRKASTHNLCLSWHTGMWVSPSCMLVLLRMLCSCSAAVLFSAVGTPLHRPSLSLCCPAPQHPVQTEPAPAQLSTHF